MGGLLFRYLKRLVRSLFYFHHEVDRSGGGSGETASSRSLSFREEGMGSATTSRSRSLDGEDASIVEEEDENPLAGLGMFSFLASRFIGLPTSKTSLVKDILIKKDTRKQVSLEKKSVKL